MGHFQSGTEVVDRAVQTEECETLTTYTAVDVHAVNDSLITSVHDDADQVVAIEVMIG